MKEEIEAGREGDRGRREGRNKKERGDEGRK